MKKHLLKISALSAGLTIIITASVLASGTGPGSPADPLVSRSFVDDIYDRLRTEISQLAAAQQGPIQLTDQILDIIAEDVIRQLDQRAAPEPPPVASAHTPVFLYSGQTIIGGEGTEIILRSGNAIAWLFGPNGISDVTAGVDIHGNAPISHNHLLIIPRADGRGIRATTDAWFLVKGAYNITN